MGYTTNGDGTGTDDCFNCDGGGMVSVFKPIGEVLGGDKDLSTAMDILSRCRSLLKETACREGVCCCGDNMEGHYSDNHTACDMGEYRADILSSDITAFLKAHGRGE